MPIVSDRGIYTKDLCADSKKYLSRLLVGKTGIDSSCITWDLLLTEKLTQLQEARNEWNQLFEENKLKHVIENKLAEIETNYLSERLKPYDPEVRKQQAELSHKKRALISLGILVALAIAFPFALPLLGGAAILVGVASTVIGTALLSYSISAFVGERLMDTEWHKEHSIEKEKWHKKISEIKSSTKTEIIKEEIFEANVNNKIVTFNQQSEAIELSKSTQPLTAEAATQTTSGDPAILKPSPNSRFFVKVTLKMPSKGIEQENSAAPTIQCRTS